MARQLFSSEDLERISRAVEEAEKKTSGEIVPYFVEQSDRYDVAAWRGGALFASIAVVGIALLHLLTETWHGLGPLEIGVITLGGLGLGVFTTHKVAALKRLLAGNDLLEFRVAQRAAQAFIAEEVFKTRDRTGILLFLSLFEHKVLVVGDSGISARVERAVWENVVETITSGIRNGRPADGLIEAIHQCGSLLQKKGVRRRRADRDELENRLRIGREQRRKSS